MTSAQSSTAKVVAALLVRICTFTVWFPALSVSLQACDRVGLLGRRAFVAVIGRVEREVGADRGVELVAVDDDAELRRSGPGRPRSTPTPR